MLRAIRLRQIFRFCLALSLFAIASAVAARSGANKRVRFTPHFSTGQVFHYSVQMHIDSVSHSTGPIVDPEGPTKAGESVSVVLRLEILSASGVSGAAHIRATYEKAAATSSSDSYDADTAAIAEQYKKLEGQSIEFTLEPSGKITNVHGLDEIISDRSRAAMISQWLNQLTLGASVPKKGIAIGEKWSSEQSLENIPLAGLAWRTESRYVRNEPCPAVRSEVASGAAAQQLTPASMPEQCAIIMTRSEITGARSEKSSEQTGGHPEQELGQNPGQNKDRTPEVFRKNGLRTAGVWTGTGDGLTEISLRTGMVVSVTQTGTTHMDFTIMTASAHNRMRYAGDTRSQSEITLLSESAIP